MGNNGIENTELSRMFKKGEVKQYTIKPPQEEQEQKPQEQPQVQEQKTENITPENTKDLITETTLESLKKEYKVLTMKFNKKHLATIQVLSDLQGITQQFCVEKIFDEYFENKHFDKALQEKIENRAKDIN